MKNYLKTGFTWMVLILLTLACSKSDDPTTPAAGCNISLKGVTHVFTVVVCVDATVGTTVDGLTATDATGTKAFVIARDSGDITNNSITLTTNTADMTGASTYVSNVSVTSQPTITRSGKTWTISGTAMNGMADSGPISGTCTCTN